jgi:Ran GTPase-activating protein (RanGAP) involved in mRNA processing and transport
MHLNDGDMEIVVQPILNGKKCTILDLRNNEITSVGASILAGLFYGKRRSIALLLDGNPISDAGVESIAKAIINSETGRTNIYLSSIGMTDVGCDYLAQMLKGNHGIWYLYLNNNEISDQGVRVLCESIEYYNKGLVILSLSGNKRLTDASVDALCRIIPRVFFHQLFVSNCSLSTAGEERLRVAANQRTEFILHL